MPDFFWNDTTAEAIRNPFDLFADDWVLPPVLLVFVQLFFLSNTSLAGLKSSRHGICCMKSFVLFLRKFYVRVYQQSIVFTEYVFHHYLETIKAPRFRQLHLTHKIYGQVFVYNIITVCKKCHHVRYEKTLPSFRLSQSFWWLPGSVSSAAFEEV